MASTFSRNGQIEMSSPSHIVDVKPETGFGIDIEGLNRLKTWQNFHEYWGRKWEDRLVEALKTDMRRGICGENEEGIARRQAVFGSNTYVNPPTESFFHFVRHALKDLAIIILLSCAALSLGFGMKVNGAKEGWIDGLSIFLTVCLVILVSATCNYRRHRQFIQLLKTSNDIRRCNVVRDGEEKQISRSEVVVGDIVVLKIGDQVPANGLLLSRMKVYSFLVRDHGEKVQTFCNDGLVLSGNKVVRGFSRMLVTSVGVNTEWGKSMLAISHNSNKQSHLQDRLDKLNWWNSRMSLIVTVLGTIVVLICYFTGNTKDENGSTQFKGSKTNIHQVLNSVFSIIRAAVTIQKGLPMTLKLAYSEKKMLEDEIEEMKHSACERLGCADTICINRTSSLTTNKIEVTEFRIGLGKEPMEVTEVTEYHSRVLRLREILQEGIDCSYIDKETTFSPGLTPTDIEILGSPTEEAIISWAHQNFYMDKRLLRHPLIEREHNIVKKIRVVLVERMGDDTYTDIFNVSNNTGVKLVLFS